MKTKSVNRTVNLDDMLTLEEAASWLMITKRTLIANIHRKRIPAVKINERVWRIHPRTVLDQLHARSR